MKFYGVLKSIYAYISFKYNYFTGFLFGVVYGFVNNAFNPDQPFNYDTFIRRLGIFNRIIPLTFLVIILMLYFIFGFG